MLVNIPCFIVNRFFPKDMVDQPDMGFPKMGVHGYTPSQPQLHPLVRTRTLSIPTPQMCFGSGWGPLQLQQSWGYIHTVS